MLILCLLNCVHICVVSILCVCLFVFHSCRAHCPVGGWQVTWISRTVKLGVQYFLHVGRDNGHYFWYIFCQSLYMDQCSLDGLYILYMSECIMQMFDH